MNGGCFYGMFLRSVFLYCMAAELVSNTANLIVRLTQGVLFQFGSCLGVQRQRSRLDSVSSLLARTSILPTSTAPRSDSRLMQSVVNTSGDTVTCSFEILWAPWPLVTSAYPKTFENTTARLTCHTAASHRELIVN